MTLFSRPPKLLYSYLATEMLAPFFASFVVMNGVFFLVKLIPFLNVVLELGINLPDFIRLFSYLFPNMFLYSIPMSAMMGVIICFTRLANDSEILAFKASGISLYQTLPPLILVAVFISLVTGFFSVKLIPAGETAMKQLMFQLAKEKIEKGIKEHKFTEALGDLVVYVNKIDPKTNEWKDVWVSDMRGQLQPTITMASTGLMKAEINKMLVTIVLKKGSLHRQGKDSSQIVTFDRYTLHIPLQPPTILDGEDVTRISSGSMTLSQLRNAAINVGPGTEQGIELMIHFHKRLVLPVGCLLLSLMGMPLGLQAGPGKRAVGIPLGLGLFIFYYILFTLGKIASENGTLPVIIAMWLPNLFFLTLVVYVIKRVVYERTILPGPIRRWYSRQENKVVSLAVKIRRKTNKAVITTKKLKKIPGSFRKTKYKTGSNISRPDLSEGTVHGNAQSRVFHIPGCKFYNCKNCSIEFKDTKIASQAGFEPCRFCKIALDKKSDL